MARAVLITRAAWALALVSLTWGVWRSLQPDALVDLHHVLQWTRTLAGGASPWAPGSETDYPPWALVTLTPLLLFGDSGAGAGPLWVAVNLAIGVALAAAMARLPTVPRAQRALAMAVVLAVSAFRVLSQFSLLAFALAWAGARDASPWRGGLWLGLALMKPHVAGPIWLAHLCWRDWRRVGTAALVPIALTLGAAAWLGQSPATLLADYLRTLEFVQGGAEAFTGHTDLEAWLTPFVPAVTTLAGSATLAAILAGPLLWVAVRDGARRPPQVRAQLIWYAWWGLVSLLSVRHLSYDFLLLLPFVVAWWPAPGQAGERPAPGHWPLVWRATVILLVAQVPGWWRRFAEPMGMSAAGDAVLQLDRVLCVGLYGAILWSFIRLDMTK